jgi:hypothetical protein
MISLFWLRLVPSRENIYPRSRNVNVSTLDTWQATRREHRNPKLLIDGCDRHNGRTIRGNSHESEALSITLCVIAGRSHDQASSIQCPSPDGLICR